jgi:hypothetical protein
MNLKLAQQLAQIFSLVIYVMMAAWYFAPWSKTKGRADALIPLIWVQAFRYVALQIVSAQTAGFPISNSRRDQLVYGDVLGAVLAIIAIAALRSRLRLSIPLVWLLVAETIFDIVNNVGGGIREHLFGVANGTTWLLQSFYIPLLIVALGVTIWQLYSRRAARTLILNRRLFTPTSRLQSMSR